jgi:hypothetical protein
MRKLVIIALLAFGFGADAQEIELTCITLNTIDSDGTKAKISSDICISLKDNILQAYVLEKVYTFNIIPNSYMTEYKEDEKINYEIFLATREDKKFRITHPIDSQIYAIEDLKEKALITYFNE